MLALCTAGRSTPVAADGGRYYDPVVETYQRPGNVLHTNQYYLLLPNSESANQGADPWRLRDEEDVIYLHYQGAVSQCRETILEHLKKSEQHDREIGKKQLESQCTDTGRRYEMGFKWHCYVNQAKTDAHGCDVLSCFTHFVCR